MKNIFKPVLAVALFAAIVSITSCEKTCDAGYEGSDCKTEIRAKFINEPAGWHVVEDGTASAPVSGGYDVHITSSSSAIDEIRITNVWNTFTNAVVAKVEGTKITIARQQPDADGFYVEGTGEVSGNTLTVTYKVTDETNPSSIQTDAFGLSGGSGSVWTKN